MNNLLIFSYGELNFPKLDDKKITRKVVSFLREYCIGAQGLLT